MFLPVLPGEVITQPVVDHLRSGKAARIDAR
ncbi:hypothetical protein JOD27_007654 [Lentzea nigeriaca]|nr:hypothetical protein [Lentzea nigeriaca]